MNTSQKLFKRLFIFWRIIIILISISAAQAQSGSVDLSFNPLPSKDVGGQGNSVFQPDGKAIIFRDAFQVVNGVVKNRIARLNTDGSVDSSFECNVCDFYIQNVVLQPDGKIIVSGGIRLPDYSLRAYIVRLNSDGSQDTSFTSPFSNARGIASSILTVWAVQPDGKVILGKNDNLYNTFSRYSILRLNPDGTLDNTFSTINFNTGQNPNQYINRVFLLPTGKILVKGSYTQQPYGGFLRRYNSNGTLDTTFQSPSVANDNPTNNTTYLYDFDVQTDGSILLLGNFTTINGVDRRGYAKLLPDGAVDESFVLIQPLDNRTSFFTVKVLSNGQFLMSLYSANGSKYYRFNPDGTVDYTYNSSERLNSINSASVDSTGRILVSGSFYENGKIVYKYGLLNADGSFNTSFNVNVGMLGSVSSLAIQPEGKIIINGDFTRINNIPANSIARLNPDGSVDQSFNYTRGFNSNYRKIIIQPDGKILLAGDSYYRSEDHTTTPALIRLNSDGSQDTSFNFNNSLSNSYVHSIILQSNGKIVISGRLSVSNSTTYRNSFARLNSDGSLDAGFRPILDQDGSLFAQPDGKIVIGGYLYFTNGLNRNLFRFNADGSFDDSFNAGFLIAVYQLQPLANGKFLGLLAGTSNSYELFLTRFNVNGSIDKTFQPVNFGFSYYANANNSIIEQADGSLIVAGGFITVNSIPRSTLVRIKHDGTLDLNFFTQFGNIYVNSIAKQADGKFVIGGSFSVVANVRRVGVARLTFNSSRTISPFDFDGDGRADVSVFHPATGSWKLLNSQSGITDNVRFGASTDRIVPADYDNDGKTDLAVYRNGIWYIQRSTAGFTGITFGNADDIPVPADYDGDGKADIAVFRPSNGFWYRLNSSDGQFVGVQFGIVEDKPTLGDFDGDGKADIAVFRPSTGYWYRINSSTGIMNSTSFGEASDKVVPADYDGDSKTDIAIFRPSDGVWYLQRSSLGLIGIQFGDVESIPAPADFNGDGKADIAVFQPSDGSWYIQPSPEGFSRVPLGQLGDMPVPNAFVR